MLSSRIIITALSALLGLMLSTPLFAQSAAALTRPSDSLVVSFSRLDTAIDLASHLEILEDANLEFTTEDVIAGKHDSNFYRNTQEEFAGSNINSQYWFRLSLLANDDFQDQNVILFLMTQKIAIYRLDMSATHPSKSEKNKANHQVIKKFRAGHLMPNNERDVDSALYSFRVPIVKGEVIQVIGKVNNIDSALPAKVPVQLISEKGFKKYSGQIEKILVAFYAMMLALFIYNISLFLSLRQPVYGYYLAFLLLAAFVCASIDGSTTRWILTDSPILNANLSYIGGIALGMIYTAFVYHSLDKCPFIPSYTGYFWVLEVLGGLLMLLTAFSEPRIAIFFNQSYSSLAMVVNIVVIIIGIRKNVAIAKYLLIAESCITVGGSIYMLNINGIISTTIMTIWALHAGFLAEAILLSLAIASKTRLIKQESISQLQRYEKLFEESHEGLFQYYLANQHLTCNTAYARLFGFDTKEDLFTALKEVTIQPYLKDDIFSKVRASGGKLLNYEFPTYSIKEESEVWVSLSAQVINSKTGKPESLKGSMININERKLREQAEQEALHNLRKTDELKDKFLTSISHDLRSPMNKIMGTIVRLQTFDHTKEASTDLKGLAVAASDMTLLVDRLLEFTQAQTDLLEIESSSFTLDELLRPLSKTYRERCSAKGLLFHLGIEEETPTTIYGDMKKITHILNDLLDNALKFTESGVITLDVSAKMNPQEFEGDYNYAFQFRVKDTGSGIEKNDYENIFSAFTQADGSFARQHGGMGLGLSMCRRFVDLVDGDISVTSELHYGSTFIFSVDLDVSEEDEYEE